MIEQSNQDSSVVGTYLRQVHQPTFQIPRNMFFSHRDNEHVSFVSLLKTLFSFIRGSEVATVLKVVIEKYATTEVIEE